MIRRNRHLALLPLLLFAVGCTGLSASNVGDPSLQDRLDFRSRLAMLHVGMPVDSLELLFAPAQKPGETGILHRARIATSDDLRLTFDLGWRSDPRHQPGHKAIEEIDVMRARVIVEGGCIRDIQHMD